MEGSQCPRSATGAAGQARHPPPGRRGRRRAPGGALLWGADRCRGMGHAARAGGSQDHAAAARVLGWSTLMANAETGSLFPAKHQVDTYAWVIWTYDPAEWAAFDAQEIKQAWRETWTQLLAALVPPLLFVAWVGPGERRDFLFGFVGVYTSLTLVRGIITYYRRLAAAREHRQARAKGPREIRIGARGLVEAGSYSAF